MLTTDRDLAANIGVTFHTPEEFFLNAPTEPYDHVFEPDRYFQSADNPETATINAAELAVSTPFTKNSQQELVIFCGSPGAGKSTFFWDGRSCSNTLQP